MITVKTKTHTYTGELVLASPIYVLLLIDCNNVVKIKTKEIISPIELKDLDNSIVKYNTQTGDLEKVKIHMSKKFTIIDSYDYGIRERLMCI